MLYLLYFLKVILYHRWSFLKKDVFKHSIFTLDCISLPQSAKGGIVLAMLKRVAEKRAVQAAWEPSVKMTGTNC